MKRTKQILSMLLAVIMAVSMLPVPAFAADTVKYLVYVTDAPLDGNGGTVIGEGEYAPGDQVTVSIVPNKAGGYCAAQWASADLGMSPIPAFNQKTSHTFTMPAQNVEISITFVNHELKFYRSLENKTHVAYCLQCNETSDTPEDCIDEVGGADELGPPDERCDKCGYDWHVHSFVDAYGSNDTHHWRSCSACGDEQVDYTPHAYGTAWSFDEINHYHTCVCGKQTDVTPHSMATDWTSDEEGHGHFCSCGATFDFEEHNPGPAATETTAQTCIDCGYELAPALGHTHSYGTLKHDADNHWYECSCGDETAVTAHSYEYECTAKCSGCDYERLTTHVYDGEDYGDSKQHLLRCRYCGVQYRTDNLTSVFPHEYDDDCDSVCDICGYERTDAHNYEWIKDADGHEEKCSVCGNVMAAKTAHTSDSPATDDTPETCSVCGYEMAPKLESTLTIVYNDTDIGGELAYHPGRAIYKFPTGTVVDLSDYWPEKREYTVDGEKYTFWNFTPNAGYGNLLTSVTLNQDTTVYACWVTTGNMHTITFDATGGSVVPKKSWIVICCL